VFVRLSHSLINTVLLCYMYGTDRTVYCIVVTGWVHVFVHLLARGEEAANDRATGA